MKIDNKVQTFKKQPVADPGDLQLQPTSTPSEMRNYSVKKYGRFRDVFHSREFP